MKTIRYLLLLVPTLALAAACGGDSAPTLAEYIAKMDAVDKDVDARFDTLFGEDAEPESAKARADTFGEGVAFALDQYDAVSPAKEAKDAHERIVSGLRDYQKALPGAVEELEEDAPPEDFESIFGDEDITAAEEKLNAAFCDIQKLADDNSIEADVGCDADGEEELDDESPTPDGDGSSTPDPETEAKVQELLDDADAATTIVDTFWATHWSEFFTESYVSPTVYGGYFGSENPDCGGIYADGSGNAYYCPADDYLAWDWELLAAKFLDDEIGDSFVYFVIAHEWGHAIQQRLDLGLVNLDAELQADCLAAAALTGATADGTLIFEPGDRGEIFQSLTFVADELEWGDSADHGSADERIESYQLGETSGVESCLPSE